MLEEIIVTIEHLTAQTYRTRLFRPLTESRWHLEESCFERPSFHLETPLSMNALSRFELFNFPSLYATCIYENTRGGLSHRNVTTFYLRTMKTENFFPLGFSDQWSFVEI